ncbi:MAG: ATP-binding protein [Spirochaetia bacterium]
MSDGVQQTRLAAQRQELSCVSVLSLLTYLGQRAGEHNVARIVEPLGLPVVFLREKSNWISFDYYNRLLQCLVEATGDELAPFHAAFSVRPQEVFDYILYAAYTTLWSGSPRAAYALSLGSSFYKRWTKIGDFEVISSSPSSMKVALGLKEGYRQTRHNCQAVQGILASVPMGMGLPPADIRETECAADGAPRCVYELKWRNRSRGIFAAGLPVLAALIAAEGLLFPGIFHLSGMIITALSFTTGAFLLRSLQFWKSLRQEEYVSLERNEHMVRTMAKIEGDYAQLREAKIGLEERTQFLSIVNEAAALVARESTRESLLLAVRELITGKLEFLRGDFFQPLGAGLSYAAISEEQCIIPSEEYGKLTALGNRVSRETLEAGGLPCLRRWKGAENAAELYCMPVQGADASSGFYLFSSGKASTVSPSFVAPLFDNVARQMKVALLRIGAKKVIDNILASIPAFVLIFDARSLLVKYVNRHFLLAFPGSGSETRRESALVGFPLSAALGFSPAAMGAIEQAAWDLESDGKAPAQEITQGSTVYGYSLFLLPEAASAERLAGIIITDISDAKYFQNNLLINQKLLALGRVASGIAHEINNPLYAVLANAEEIADDASASEQTRVLAGEIVEHVVNVSSVIKDLSNYSKTLRREEKGEVDVNAVIEESLVLVRYGSNLMQVEIVRDLAPLPPVRAAKGEMQQVLINIINNAIQAMDGKGTLTIRSRHAAGRIEIEITDTGKGIADADLPFIFDLFFSTKGPGQGTGQGLYIVRKILALNEGTIGVKSTPGAGATFTLGFPAAGSARG